MSVQAMTRVLSESTLRGPARMVLLVIANHETEQRGAFPAIETVARECGMSVRSVQRHIREAAEHGELEVSPSAGPHGTNLYRTLPEVAPRQSDTPDTSSPELSPELKELEARTYPPVSANAETSPQGFDAFWIAYPVHKGRSDAERAWAKAIKIALPELIIAGAKRYAAELAADPDPPRPKWAQGWLSGRRWEDEPLPARNGHRRHESAATSILRRAAAEPSRPELGG